MVANLFVASPWPGVAAWCVLYISDYVLTLKCARLYRTFVAEQLVIEGSFELTPFYQKEIDALRTWSPRFLVVLLVSSGVLALVWWLCQGEYVGLYQLVLGVMILPQLAVHVRHFRNLSQFLEFTKGGEVRGRIEYSRHFVLQGSSVELYAFAGLFTLLMAYFLDWFLAGGAISCFALGQNHKDLARKAASSSASSRDAKPDVSTPGA